MTGQNNRGRKGIQKNTFALIKGSLGDLTVAEVSKHYGISETTIRRIKNSKTYAEYKGYLAASNGNKQFNENEFEKKLDAIKSKPAHDSLHHYQNNPEYVVDEPPTWIIVAGAVVLIAIVGVAIYGVVSLVTFIVR